MSKVNYIMPEMLVILARNMAEKDGFRYYLKGVRVEPANTKDPWTRMIATDGHKLSVASILVDKEDGMLHGEKVRKGGFTYPGTDGRFGFILPTDELTRFFGNVQASRTMLPLHVEKKGKELPDVKIGDIPINCIDGAFVKWRDITGDPVVDPEEEESTKKMACFNPEYIQKCMMVANKFNGLGGIFNPTVTFKFPTAKGKARMQSEGRGSQTVAYNNKEHLSYDWTLDTYLMTLRESP